MEKVAYVVSLLIICFSCKKMKQENLITNKKEEKTKNGLITESTDKEYSAEKSKNKIVKIDTIFLKIDDIENIYVGNQIFPPDSLKYEEQIKLCKNTNVDYILNTSFFIVVINKDSLFRPYIDSFKNNYLSNNKFLDENGYINEKLEEPIGASLIKKSRDSIVVFRNDNNTLSIESIFMEKGNKLLSVLLKGEYNLKSFLESNDIILPLNIKNGEILLVNNSIVNGIWFDVLRKKGYLMKNKDLKNDTFIQYLFSIENNTIKSVEFGEFIGF